eukprot:scaffold2893_cov254-Pinguiococcus_pyrenoidosus.AAC.28
MQKACMRLKDFTSAQRKVESSDSALSGISADGPSLLDASIRLGKSITSLRGELRSLEEEEKALTEAPGQNGHSPGTRDAPEDEPDVAESFWGAGKKELPSVGDLVSTAYGDGYVSNVRTWDGFVRLRNPIAEVKLPFGRAFMCARQVKDAIRDPGEFRDSELVEKWSRHGEIATGSGQESVARLNAEADEALTMDDFGLPFEVDEPQRIQSSTKAATNAVYDLAERLLPGTKRLRQNHTFPGPLSEPLKQLLERIDSDTSRPDPMLGGGYAGRDGYGLLDAAAQATDAAAIRTRTRRPRKGLDTIEEHSSLSRVGSTDGSDASAEAGLFPYSGTLGGGEARLGSDLSRSTEEQLQRCRERVFPLTAALLPHGKPLHRAGVWVPPTPSDFCADRVLLLRSSADMLPTGRSRLALQRPPLCAHKDVEPSRAANVEEVDAYGGVLVPVPDGCTSLSDLVEQLSKDFKDLNDHELESLQYRSEISRENARRNTLPKFFQPGTLKKIHEAGQRKAEGLEGTLQDFVRFISPSAREAPKPAGKQSKPVGKAFSAPEERSASLSAEEGDGDEDLDRATPESTGSDLLIRIHSSHASYRKDGEGPEEITNHARRLNGVSGSR